MARTRVCYPATQKDWAITPWVAAISCAVVIRSNSATASEIREEEIASTMATSNVAALVIRGDYPSRRRPSILDPIMAVSIARIRKVHQGGGPHALIWSTDVIGALSGVETATLVIIGRTQKALQR